MKLRQATDLSPSATNGWVTETNGYGRYTFPRELAVAEHVQTDALAATDLSPSATNGWVTETNGRYTFPRELAVAEHVQTDDEPTPANGSAENNLVDLHQNAPELYVYNFGFGSNLSLEKMKARGTNPVSVTPATLADWRLEFNLCGYPPVEPSFANLMRSPGDEVHGVLYQLTLSDFQKVYEGEGSGSWYDTVMVEVETYLPAAQTIRTTIFTCVPAKLTPDARGVPPSTRYKTIVVTGAKAARLNEDYINRLEQQPSNDVNVVLMHMMCAHVSLLNLTSRLDQGTWVGWTLSTGFRAYSNFMRQCCIAVDPWRVLLS